MPQRVVITGLGVVSPLGNRVEAFWQNLLQGRNGIGLIAHFPTEGYSTRIAAEVRGFCMPEGIEPKQARRMALFTQYAVTASFEALHHAGLAIPVITPERVGVSIGCGIGSMQVIEEQYQILLEKGPRRVSPLLVPMFIPNMAAGQVAIYTGAKGPNNCTVTACASATHAMGDALRMIQRGEADIVLAGGTEAAITRLSLAGFCAARTMSTRNAMPEQASRPFDRDRDGFVMGEGSGILVFESLDHAQARQAPILAEVLGFAMTGDAYHITAPDPEGDGIARAMQGALKDAGLSPQDIQYINAHGTSTPINDIIETLAIKRVFGPHAYRLAISSTKSMTGHLLGAAGGIEAIATVLSLRDGRVHPTRNLENPDPQCDLDYVPHTARQLDLKAAMSNNMGFGGHNASIVFGRMQ